MSLKDLVRNTKTEIEFSSERVNVNDMNAETEYCLPSKSGAEMIIFAHGSRSDSQQNMEDNI